MANAKEHSLHESLIAGILSDETFHPAAPKSIDETGLSPTLIEDLILKYILAVGSASGRDIADHICLTFVTLEDLLRSLRARQLLVHTGSAQLGDYVYTLTEQGRTRAQSATTTCAYVGSAPVTLAEYVLSVEAQTIRAESPKRGQLETAFADISVTPSLFESLGPAVNSGAGLFLYGEPGNGKTTLAKRITSCFGQTIYVPRAVVEDGQVIKVFDDAYHEPVEDHHSSLMKTGDHDQRWVRIRRPTVIVGGELTLDSLEIRHDPHSNVSEAPIQMKSNCGCLLIDDFGRQRVEPLALLNRWIVPLENRIDYLSLPTGKKIQIPFEQLIIFSTNLEPADLVDEAFLRRIPYKIHVTDPDVEEYHRLFRSYASTLPCECDPAVVDWLLDTHYRPYGRALRRCHPRDLLGQVRNYCNYHDLPIELRPEYLDRVVPSYFTVVKGMADVNALQSGPGDSREVQRPVPAIQTPPASSGSPGDRAKDVRPSFTECMPGEEPSSDGPIVSEVPGDGAKEVRQHVTECIPGQTPSSGIAIELDRRVTESMPALG
jgi:hypothetical protein